uniref:Uncharacterized protein n=1 Tax=Micrurus lemniscatus lemniscatus TaxID=129467 RepID=A0A2D4JNA9_MICLE
MDCSEQGVDLIWMRELESFSVAGRIVQGVAVGSSKMGPCLISDCPKESPMVLNKPLPYTIVAFSLKNSKVIHIGFHEPGLKSAFLSLKELLNQIRAAAKCTF